MAFSSNAGNRTGGEARGYLAIAVGWLIPGAGHWMVGDRRRGLIFTIAIHTLFIGGILLGGVRALNRPRQRLWDYSQYLAGWPMLIGSRLRSEYFPSGSRHPSGFAPLVQEVATAYCGLAGMLNLLVLVDLFMLVSGEESACRTGKTPGASPPGGGRP